MKSKVPVTVLSGYLGSGKTTLLNHILRHNKNMKFAVIVNDMSEVNIDADMVKRGGFKRTEETLVELQNGCICCTLREDLLIEVEKLAMMDVDYILIESTGISEPIPVAQSFTYKDEESGIYLGAACRLDTMVTVVDAYRFWDDYQSGESLVDRKQGADDADVREVIDLLIDQIEFADVIVLNKIDLVENEEQAKLRALLHQLNPEARIIVSEHAQVAADEILNTASFDFEKASQSAGWIKELNEEHIAESDEYNITSFVYRSKKPFHPQRFMTWLENWPEQVVRSKGFFWLATRNNTAGLLSQAGTSLTIQGAGSWVSALPLSDQHKVLAEDPELLTRWDHQFGDRLTELVFIGIDMEQQRIESTLNQCLLTEEEMKSEWELFHDPLPSFTTQESTEPS
ncbi:GTP-binding protein [Halobacillus sp. A5]|uniref:GTP-binding protein n=1 Tax=Halobacillus sp. A5 TaxID=2880263 RepID=UPI0020A6AD04|nr:GTP-binding protein [Halobacillus sp. A5]MCP3026564.1 GTP-binding protein [Halobacillus sp. A5]